MDLINIDRLSFTLQENEALSFDLASNGSIEFDLETPIAGGANVFNITLTLTNREWIPDKTFSEIEEAHKNGDIFVFDHDYTLYDSDIQTYYVYVDDVTPNYLNYWVSWYYANTRSMYVDFYTYDSDGVWLTNRDRYSTPTWLVEKTITQNGTYDPILTDYADGYSLVTVNVSGGSSDSFKTGSVTFDTTYNTTGNRLICSLSDIGFTPKCFYLNIRDRSTVSGISSVVLRTSYETDNGGNHLRVTTRFVSSAGALDSSQKETDWTIQSNAMLYNNGANIYFRTTNAYIISANTTYDWIAIG